MALIRFSDRLTKLLMILAAVWAFGLCFVALADIIFRAINLPLQGTKEIVANSIVIIVFLQVSFAIRSGSMLNADFLIHGFTPKVRRVLTTFGLLLGAAFFAILFHGGIDPAFRSFANGEFDGEGALRVPVWPTRFAILIGSALAVVNYLLLAAIEILDLDVEDVSL
jgi:TRAP-type C4-dicarboxylate transport system permease small subunit